MTKAMQDVIAAAAVLPDDAQNVLAVQFMDDIRAMSPQGDVPDWHQRLLDERRQLRLTTPERLVPAEVVRQRLDVAQDRP